MIIKLINKNTKIGIILLALGMFLIPGFVSANSDGFNFDGSFQVAEATCVYTSTVDAPNSDRLVLNIETTFKMKDGKMISQTHEFIGATGGYGEYEILTKNGFGFGHLQDKVGDLKILKGVSHKAPARFRLAPFDSTTSSIDAISFSSEKGIVCPQIYYISYVKEFHLYSDWVHMQYRNVSPYSGYESHPELSNLPVSKSGTLTLNKSKTFVIQPSREMAYKNLIFDYRTANLDGEFGLKIRGKDISVTNYSYFAKGLDSTKTWPIDTSSLDVSKLSVDKIYDEDGKFTNINIYYCLTNSATKEAYLSFVSDSSSCVLVKSSYKDVNADLYSVSRGDLSYDLASGLKLVYNPGPLNCSSFGKLFNFITDFYNLILIIGAVALIILGMLDFVKAVSSEKPEAMKKAWKNFATRIAIMFLLALLPALLTMTFSIFNIKTCLPSAGGYEYVSNS